VVPTGKERKEGPFLTQYRVVTGQDHMEQVTLGLRMATSKKFFNNILHTMKIRCTASMGVLMWHSEHTTRIHSRSSAPLAAGRKLISPIDISSAVFDLHRNATLDGVPAGGAALLELEMKNLILCLYFINIV
jgi:hypothetical protein